MSNVSSEIVIKKSGFVQEKCEDAIEILRGC